MGLFRLRHVITLVQILYIGTIHIAMIACEKIICHTYSNCGPCSSPQQCLLSCIGEEQCKGSNMVMTCKNTQICDIICNGNTGNKACVDSTIYIKEATTNATIYCLSEEDCQKVTIHSAAKHLAIHCIQNNHNCHYMSVHAEASQSVVIHCDGPFACKNMNIYCGSDDCLVHCNSMYGNACEGLDLVCGSGHCQIDCTYDNCQSISVDTYATSHFTCIGSTGDCRFAPDSFRYTTLSPTLPTKRPTPIPTMTPTQIPSSLPTLTPIHTTNAPTTHMPTTVQPTSTTISKHSATTSTRVTTASTASVRESIPTIYADDRGGFGTTINLTTLGTVSVITVSDSDDSIDRRYVITELGFWFYVTVACAAMVCGLTAMFGIMSYLILRSKKRLDKKKELKCIEMANLYSRSRYSVYNTSGEFTHGSDEGAVWNEHIGIEEDEKDEIDGIHNDMAHNDDEIVHIIDHMTDTG
eukprot:179940_1